MTSGVSPGRACTDLLRYKAARIGVVGLGYVGLPLAKAFVDAGFATIGFDVDSQKVERLRAGESYIKHLPGEWIAGQDPDGQFDPRPT